MLLFIVLHETIDEWENYSSHVVNELLKFWLMKTCPKVLNKLYYIIILYDRKWLPHVYPNL